MSRLLIGHERTRARKAVAALASSEPADVARRLGMRRHTIAAILDGRMRPGRTFAEHAARLHGVGLASLLGSASEPAPAAPV